MAARLALLAVLGSMALLLAACNGGGSQPATPTGEPSPMPSPAVTETAEATPTPTIEEEVSEAYLRYWDVYSEGLFDLETSRFDEVMRGPRLERAVDEIESLRQDGRAVKIVVENHPVVVKVEGDEAVVFDEYENDSYLIDPETKEPVGDPGTGEVIRDTVTLTRSGQTWKVLDSVREVE